MPIITISRGSYSRGKEVAEKLSEKLGYECLARDVLIEASEEFNIPEAKLVRALKSSPSILDRFTYGREKYIAYIEHTFLDHVKKGNVVYHGLAGHFFLKNAPDVLKVRILANMEDRVKEEMNRENISENEARKLLIKDDGERRKWSRHLYGIDTGDSSLYDLVVHIDKFTVDDAVDLIASASALPCFQSNPQTRAFIEDLYLAAKAKAILINHIPTVNVTCREGVVQVSCKGVMGNEKTREKKINTLLNGIAGIERVQFDVKPIIVPD